MVPRGQGWGIEGGWGEKSNMSSNSKICAISGSVAPDSSFSSSSAPLSYFLIVFIYIRIHLTEDIILFYRSTFCCLSLKTVVFCSDKQLIDRSALLSQDLILSFKIMGLE